MMDFVSIKMVIRYYKAPVTSGEGETGSWYAEYDGTFSVREFVLTARKTLVAPFDFPFRGPNHPTQAPPVEGITSISFSEFQSLWEQWAQGRLNELSVQLQEVAFASQSAYYEAGFPAELKRDGEGESKFYYEFADDVARRHFEVLSDTTRVAPYDIGTPEGDGSEWAQAAESGLDETGQPIDPRICPEVISHALFETQWERHAMPRLHSLVAEQASQ